MKYKSRKSKRLPIFILILVFLGVKLSGQSSITRIDSVYCVSANDSLHAPISYLNRGVRDNSTERLYLPLERQLAKNDFVFLKFDTRDQSFEYVILTLPDSVQRDFSYSVSHCFANNGVMHVVADKSYEFDLATHSLIRQSDAEVPELLYKSENIEIRGLYREVHPLDYPVHSVISSKNEQDQSTKSIYPPIHEVGLTRFRPCNLLRVNERYVIRASVSRPVVYLYNQDLELLDSLCFLTSGEWKDVEGVFSEKERRKMKRAGFSVFDYYSEAFQRGVYKAQNIAFTESNHFYLAFSSPFPEYGMAAFLVDEFNKIKLLEMRPIAITTGVNSDPSVSVPRNIYANGIFCSGKFYLWTAGDCDAEESQDRNNQPVQTPSCAYQPPGIRLLECRVPY
jgi:hypothetical protein